jgi:putative transposase
VRVKGPRVRDRRGTGLRFHSALVPPSIRRSQSLEALWPWLALQGVSTGDFSAALQALWGPAAPGLSPATLSRLNQLWQEARAQWQGRSRVGKRSGYCWGDGVSCETRLEEARQCILVIIGADASGPKALVGRWAGSRESEQSWTGLRLDRQSRGLEHGPTVALGDGALGLWKALRPGYGQTRWQRCRVQKTAPGLDQRPQALPPQAKHRLPAIWMAPDRQRAARAVALCVATDDAPYPKAAECLAHDRAVL